MTTHDPVVSHDTIPLELRPRVSHFNDLTASVAGAEVVVIVTRWSEYLELPALLQRAQRQPLVVDGRRMLDPESVARYRGVGYPETGK